MTALLAAARDVCRFPAWPDYVATLAKTVIDRDLELACFDVGARRAQRVQLEGDVVGLKAWVRTMQVRGCCVGFLNLGWCLVLAAEVWDWGLPLLE